MNLFDAPVSDYMCRDLETASPDTPLQLIARAMHGRGISAIPVVDNEGTITGVVSRTDLIHLGVRHSGRRWTSPVMPFPRQVAADVMTGPPRVIEATMSLRHAGRMMVEHRIHRLFVVDDNDHAIGVISTVDLAAAVRDSRIETPICEVMTRQVIKLDVRATLATAIEMLERVPITGVIVTEEDLPIGMFTQLDAIASRDLPRGTPIDEVYEAAVICLPDQTKLHRAATFAAKTDVRRIVVCRNRDPVGVISGLDFARVVAGPDLR
ncbi:MAG: CBS domain-containing protein [Kofleriaceae bacterium]